MTEQTDQRQTYLGDGVYGSFDGYQIWLAVNHHDNVVVALEPKVLQSLLQYAVSIYGQEIFK